jgi:hypothetical protein
MGAIDGLSPRFTPTTLSSADIENGRGLAPPGPESGPQPACRTMKPSPRTGLGPKWLPAADIEKDLRPPLPGQVAFTSMRRKATAVKCG